MIPRLAPILAMVALPVQADIFDDADITLNKYSVTGSSLAEVQDDMAAKGPHGYWAWTNWRVTWDADCVTTVTADITLPELSDDADLTEAELAEFDRMSQALETHELGHVQIGLDYAAAAEEAGCPKDTAALDADFAQREKDYDAETQHGLTQGATLHLP